MKIAVLQASGSQSFGVLQNHIIPFLNKVPRLQRRPLAEPLVDYRMKSRKGMALAYLTGDYAMKAIADEFQVHYTTVSRAVKEYEEGVK